MTGIKLIGSRNFAYSLKQPLMNPIASSELILNPDGSIYHLKLRPEQIADTIIVVGDPGRVMEISKHFSTIEHKVQNREFVTHTGICNGKRITALATGIGTDNIDIVINELDALVNIDLEKRIPKETHTELRIVRLGTSGALQADIEIETFIASRYGLGFDGLLNYYKMEGNAAFDIPMADAFIKEAKWMSTLGKPYMVKGSDTLFNLLSEGLKSGITATSPGFYGPQGRILRLKTADPDLNEKIEAFRYKDLRITNFEMETSALYGLSALLGHQACTLCTIIANRVAKKFSKDYHPAVERMIEWTLERLTR